MTKDRLSNIWNGFAQRSSLDLSGTTIDDTQRPPRRDESYQRAYALPQVARDGDATPGHDPVAAALSAMHTQMQASEGNNGRRSQAQQPLTAQFSSPPESALEKTLLADISFTRAKTTRSDGDYLSYAASRQADWQKRKRKKFLGIF